MTRQVSRALGALVIMVALSVSAARAVAAGASPNPGAPAMPAAETRGERPTDANGTRDEGAKKRPEQRARAPFLGATFDVGFPDGAVVGIAARPWHWLRLATGAGTNAVSLGIRGGVALIPLGVGPCAVVEGGYYFEGNANTTASLFSGSSSDGNRMADRFGYQFVNLHGGIELGQERFTFFLHGGMSYLHSVLYNANDVLGGASENTTVTTTGNSVFTAWVPSLKLGFIFYVV